jgi:hypothetical protein
MWQWRSSASQNVSKIMVQRNIFACPAAFPAQEGTSWTSINYAPLSPSRGSPI